MPPVAAWPCPTLSPEANSGRHPSLSRPPSSSPACAATIPRGRNGFLHAAACRQIKQLISRQSELPVGPDFTLPLGEP